MYGGGGASSNLGGFGFVVIVERPAPAPRAVVAADPQLGVELARRGDEAERTDLHERRAQREPRRVAVVDRLVGVVADERRAGRGCRRGTRRGSTCCRSRAWNGALLNASGRSLVDLAGRRASAVSARAAALVPIA